MTIKAELNFLEFHNSKDTLEPGFYRVVEEDGEVSFAAVSRYGWQRGSSVKWMTEDEYLEHLRMDQSLAEDWDRDGSEFRRISPEDLAETEANNADLSPWELEVMKQDDQRLCDEICLAGDDLSDVEFNQLRAQALESNQCQSEAFNSDMAKKKEATLGDLLREALASPTVQESGGYQETTLEAAEAFAARRLASTGNDPRFMTTEQYAEHCEVVEQNRKDGVNL